MGIDLDRVWLSRSCLVCGYEIEFTVLQARLEETVFCPCCKQSVQLVDETASVEIAKRTIDQAVTELQQSQRKLNRSFRIRL